MFVNGGAGSTIGLMQNSRLAKRPLWIFLVSFMAIIGLVLLTSPLQNVVWAVGFFILLAILVLSLGRLLLGLKSEVTPRDRSSLAIISLALVLGLMFKSASSFSWLDIGVLILICLGLLFYSRRR